MRIAVYTIMKNELQNIDEWFAQFENADTITVLDTGSDDESYAALATKMDKRIHLHSATIDPFDFSIARNMALNEVRKHYGPGPQDVLCLWLDMDERLDLDWYQKICDYVIDNNIDLTKHNAFEATMIFDRSSDGSPSYTYSQRKIHCLYGFEWMYTCHEILVSTDGTNESFIHPTNITVDHKKDKSKKRDYLPLLEENWKKHPDDLRALYYLAREHTYNGDWDTAALLIQQNVPNLKYMITDAQLIELYNLQVSACFKTEGHRPEPWIHAALAINDQNVEALLNYAFCEYYKQDTYGVLYWSQKGLRALNKDPNQDKKVIYNKSREAAWQLLDLAGLASDTLGYLNEAVQYYVQIHNNYQDMLDDEDAKRVQTNILSLSKRLNLEVKHASD